MGLTWRKERGWNTSQRTENTIGTRGGEINYNDDDYDDDDDDDYDDDDLMMTMMMIMMMMILMMTMMIIMCFLHHKGPKTGSAPGGGR